MLLPDAKQIVAAADTPDRYHNISGDLHSWPLHPPANDCPAIYYGVLERRIGATFFAVIG